MTAPLRGLRIGLVTASASRLGGEPHVFALRDPYSAEDGTRLDRAHRHLFEIKGPRQVGFAPSLLRGLLAADLDCLHLHGVWMYPSAAAAAWAGRTGKAYVVSPHGMLDPWITARGRWKKALARLGYERLSWLRASRLHALTRREADDVARETGRRDSLVIPNAGPATRRPESRSPGSTVVYIGRIHPKKNLAALVKGWALARRPGGARLVIAGWGEDDHVAALRGVLASTDGSAQFIGPVYGREKERLIATARFVVLPSHSEGLPMAMLEAWAAGVPTIMTAECNLPEGFGDGAALETGYIPADIALCLERGFALPEPDWRAMSIAASGLAAGRFSEETVASEWAEAYLQVIGSTSREAVCDDAA